ncbi:MAG TPA: cytochrome c biogenesis protein CcsA, partial [Candidatus Kapabacteria bacterium]|nr:cytochrome c biogenesis protein CcsA [Candidatus Kapabacteria bacterium]
MLSYITPILFSASLVSAISYWLVSRGRKEFFIPARVTFHIATIGTMVAAAILMYLIQTDQFQYSYVWHYSSRELSTIFKYSAFYTGQEGSFLLWALYIGVIGIVLMQYAAKQKYEVQVMRVFVMVQAFLLLMIVVKNPFIYIWQAMPQATVGFVPRDGFGLNPLLQNYWIAIHPPMLFLGFASMTVPFVFAVAGLQKRDYQGWITTAMPWVLFGSMILGFGIMLGGFWAYETLGWGGFWGWDPVENSSLIPWLACIALVHTMLTQKRTKGLVKTNFVLAIFTFLLVLYSTFLTRSGVLGSASNHSFEDPGMYAYVLLLVFIAIFAAIGIVPLVRRAKDLIPLGKEYKVYSRETALGIGSAVLAACAVIVLLGTSWPIFAKAAVDVSYYNNLNLPIAIIIGLLNGLALLLKWRTTAPKELFKHSMFALIAAFVATVFIIWFGLNDIRFILLTFASFFALFVNVQIGYRIAQGNRRFIGAYVSHFGVSLLFLGIVATAHYSEKASIELTQGQEASALGYKFTFLGKQQIETDKVDREKYLYNIKITKGNEDFIVHPVVFWSE